VKGIIAADQAVRSARLAFVAGVNLEYHETNTPHDQEVHYVRSQTQRVFWILLGLSVVFSALILLIMPAEKTIGSIIKVVYLHGALSRAGMLGLMAAGAVGLAYLIRPQPALARWTKALALSGWAYWTAHFIVSMPATRFTWGPWIAWGEPRVTMTLQIMLVGLAVIAVSWLVADERFAAAANLLLATAVVVLAARTGVLRHPLDPIGQSPSGLLRWIYLALLVPVVGSMVLVAWRLTQTRKPAPAIASEIQSENREHR